MEELSETKVYIRRSRVLWECLVGLTCGFVIVCGLVVALVSFALLVAEPTTAGTITF